MTEQNRIRVAVAVSSRDQNEFALSIAHSLASCEDVELLIFLISCGQHENSSRIKGLQHTFSPNVCFRKILRKRCPSLRDISFDNYRKSTSSQFPHLSSGVKIVEADVLDMRHAVEFHRIDLVIDLSPKCKEIPKLYSMRFGYWRFTSDDGSDFLEPCPGFRDMYFGFPTSKILLRKYQNDQGDPEDLLVWSLPIVSQKIAVNCELLLFFAALMPGVALERERRSPNNIDVTVPLAISEGVSGKSEAVTGGCLALISKVIARRIKAIFVPRLLTDKWSVGLIHLDSTEQISPPPTKIDQLDYLKSGGYLADPFEMKVSSGRSILVEEFNEKDGLGRISLLRLDANSGCWHLKSGVIPTESHASFPTVLSWDGATYAVVETWQSNSVSIWKLEDEFGEKWEKVKILVDGLPLVDPVVFRHKDLWWLLATRQDIHPNSALYAWTTENLLGEWHAHPLNPLKVDVRCTRAAGVPFVVHGKLIRPAQDCSSSYGSSISLMEIEALDEFGLREHLYSKLLPWDDRYFKGLHTMNKSDHGWVIDNKTLVFSASKVWRRIEQFLS